MRELPSLFKMVEYGDIGLLALGKSNLEGITDEQMFKWEKIIGIDLSKPKVA